MGPDAISRTPAIAEPDRYFEWSFPGAPVRIFLKLPLVARILEYLMRSFEEDPAHPAEAGGILLGTSAPKCVWISGFAPFRRASPAASFFVLSNVDVLELGALARRPGVRDPRLRAVGFFRSQARDGLRLYEDDVRVLDYVFPAPSSVALVVKPGHADEVATAGFFFRERGTIFADCSYMPFPFDARLLAIEGEARGDAEPPIGERPEQRDANTPALPSPRPSKPVLPPAPQNSKARRPKISFKPGPRAKAVAGIAVVLVCAAVFLARRHSPLPPQPRGGTAVAKSDTTVLSVARAASGLAITWDPASDLVQSAAAGLITVEDGARKREIRLTPAMLASGKMAYKPASDTVTISFELVHPRGNTRREAVVYLSNTLSAQTGRSAGERGNTQAPRAGKAAGPERPVQTGPKVSAGTVAGQFGHYWAALLAGFALLLAGMAAIAAGRRSRAPGLLLVVLANCTILVAVGLSWADSRHARALEESKTRPSFTGELLECYVAPTAGDASSTDILLRADVRNTGAPGEIRDWALQVTLPNDRPRTATVLRPGKGKMLTFHPAGKPVKLVPTSAILFRKTDGLALSTGDHAKGWLLFRLAGKAWMETSHPGAIVQLDFEDNTGGRHGCARLMGALAVRSAARRD